AAGAGVYDAADSGSLQPSQRVARADDIHAVELLRFRRIPRHLAGREECAVHAPRALFDLRRVEHVDRVDANTVDLSAAPRNGHDVVPLLTQSADQMRPEKPRGTA